MALVFKDRVKETTTTTGTGTVTLAGAVTGYQSFSAIGNGNTTYYCIAGQSGSEWEVGIGTYTSAGTTLSRDTVLASSNAGSLVTFSAGTKDVFCTYSAAKSVNLDANGNVTIASPAQTAANPALAITQTWNNAATTFTGLQLNVTNTASAAGSELIDLQIGGSSRMNLTKEGTPTFYPQTAADSGFKVSSAIQSYSNRFQMTTGEVSTWATNVYYNGTAFAKDELARGGWRMAEVCSPTADASSSFLISYFPIGSTGENLLFEVNGGGDIKNYGPVSATGKFTSTATTSGSSNTGAFNYGALSYSDQNNLMTLQSSVNSYNQLVLQNTSANSAASADLTISNDQGTATTFYGNFGINSSGWLGTLGSTSLNAANVVYLTGTSGDLVLGTTTSHGIHFVVAAGADAVTIDTSSRVGIGVTSPTASLHLEAGTATANTAPLKFTSGTLLSAAEAATVEYDGVVYYTTPNTTSGRGYTPSTHIFRLTATGSAFGPAIGNFFGANSAINLAAGGVYEIEAHCYFTKTTAGTVTVTITSSLAPVNLNGVIQTGAVGGGTAVGAANQIALYNSTATAAAFGATASLTTAVSHYMKISLIVEANASASNLRINFTSSAGTVTPLRGSYYKVTRLPAGNSGSYAA